MIEFTAYNTTTGKIVRSMTTNDPAVRVANVNAGEADIDGLFSAAHLYFDLTDPQSPVVADRPVWNPFPATGAAPLVVDITDAPAGTSLTVADEGGEVTTVSDFTQPLTFVDAGGYTVNIAPPFPYQAITQKVTAT